MFTFKKSERMTSLKEIESLFERGHSSAVQAYPLRAVYQMMEATDDNIPSIKILVSVAKKRLHHAVDRNRAKRQIREAYRLQHAQLTTLLQQKGKRMHMALIWLSEGPQPTDAVFKATQSILQTIEERLQNPDKSSKSVKQ